MARPIIVIEASLLAIGIFLLIIIVLKRFKRNEKIVNFLRSQWWFQPNAIGYERTTMMFLSWILFFLRNGHGMLFTAVFLFVLAALFDSLDGFVARNFNLVTPEGKRLDPILDKINALPPMLYCSLWDFWRMFLWLTMLIADLIGEFRVRKWLSDQSLETSSNRWGKFKTPSCFTTVVICVMFATTPKWTIYLFGLCTVLSVMSCLMKVPRGRRKEFSENLWDNIPGPTEAMVIMGMCLTKVVRRK